MRHLPLIAAALLICASSAHAQNAATSALGAPALARTATPAATATVKPGSGGGPATSGAPPADRPPLPERMAPDDQVLVNVRRLPTLGWPSTPIRIITTGINHIGGELVRPDGRVISLDNNRPPMWLETAVLTRPLLDGVAMSSKLVPDGDNLRVYISIGLGSGDYIEPPPFTIPTTGGTQTLRLSDGSSLTVVIDGAHVFTAAERAQVDEANARFASSERK